MRYVERYLDFLPVLGTVSRCCSGETIIELI
jgi:hypothetical protein